MALGIAKAESDYIVRPNVSVVLVYNSLFCVLQIVKDTDRKHKSNLDKITKLQQNLNNEKKIV